MVSLVTAMGDTRDQLLREGVEQFGSAPFSNADWDALDAMGEEVERARAMAG